MKTNPNNRFRNLDRSNNMDDEISVKSVENVNTTRDKLRSVDTIRYCLYDHFSFMKVYSNKPNVNPKIA